MHPVDLAYARARVQARHGDLPDAGVWRQLEASHSAAHYLALARSGPLAPWLAGLAEAVEPHRVEDHLRARWQRYVAEVAGWLPLRWQAAARWFATLPELPLADEPVRSDTAAGWLQAWQRLLPDAPEAAAQLPQLCALLMPRLPGANGGRVGAPAGRAAVPETERLALLKLFRQHGASLVGVFAHLALVALTVERLRGGIVSRALLAPPQGPETSANPVAKGL